MEKGNAVHFKNKSLEEIDVDMETIDEVEFNNDQNDITNTTVLGIINTTTTVVFFLIQYR